MELSLENSFQRARAWSGMDKACFSRACISCQSRSDKWPMTLMLVLDMVTTNARNAEA